MIKLGDIMLPFCILCMRPSDDMTGKRGETTRCHIYRRIPGLRMICPERWSIGAFCS